jgi:hypothetical protein
MALMKQKNLLKFIFTVKTKQGVIVRNLQISAPNQTAAEQHLRQMYRQCTIIDMETNSGDPENINLEKVLDLIVNG